MLKNRKERKEDKEFLNILDKSLKTNCFDCLYMEIDLKKDFYWCNKFGHEIQDYNWEHCDSHKHCGLTEEQIYTQKFGIPKEEYQDWIKDETEE